MVASAAPRSQFNGVLTVGMVTVPVKLVTAVRAERVSFHLLHDQDHVRLSQRMVCPADGKEIHPEHRVKGFEVAPDQYVIVQESDLEAAKPAKSREIAIDAFVRPEEIDPRHFEKPYYLLAGENAAKNYRLLVEAMTKTGRVAIAKFVMRDKEYLACVRPVGEVLALYTMRYAEELVSAREAAGREFVDPKPVRVDDRELKMATQLVESLAAEFNPGEYRNDFVRKVKELIEAKARGEEVELSEPVVARATPTRSLADMLEASLKHLKGAEGGGKSEGKMRVETHHRARGTTKKK